MRKLILLIIFFIFMPAIVSAQSQALNLKDTVIGSGLSLSSTEDKYVENDKQVTVYLFRSPSCNHCHSAIEFFDSLVEEYGEKFKMRSYDCESNSSNRALQKKVTEFLDINAPNVPLIVIGKNTFYGFSDKTKDKVVETIEKEYNSKVRFDVFEEMEKGKTSSKKPKYIIAGILILGVVVGLILVVKKN